MKTIFLFLLPVFILAQHFNASAQPVETIIKTQALEMARAILAKDVNKIILYLPPKLVADAGGKDKLLSARDTLNKFMKQFGAEIQKVIVGNPGKIVTYKNQLQTTLPQTTTIKFMAGTATMESTLIAISEDKGQHWYFVDNSIYGRDKLKSSLPDISPELTIPPVKPPKIIADQQ